MARHQECREVGLGRRFVGRGDGAVGEFLPEITAAAERERQRLHARAPRPGGVGPAREALRDQRLDLGADRLAEDRRSAVGRNADDERRAIDDGAESEIAEGSAVDDVDRHAGGPRRRGERGGLGVVGAIADGDGRASEVGRGPLPLVQRDRADRRRSGERAHVLRRRRSKDIDLRPGGGEELRLPDRRLRPAGDEAAFALQREERRQARQGGHAGRTNFRGGAAHASHPGSSSQIECPPFGGNRCRSSWNNHIDEVPSPTRLFQLTRHRGQVRARKPACRSFLSIPSAFKRRAKTGRPKTRRPTSGGDGPGQKLGGRPPGLPPGALSFTSVSL